jgi:hypothetical protein
VIDFDFANLCLLGVLWFASVCGTLMYDFHLAESAITIY